MPFGRAAKELKYFTRVEVSEATARRITEQSGSDYVEVQNAEVDVIVNKAPASPPGPELQLISVDGAMVHVVTGEWVEVKTAALGEVKQVTNKKGITEPHTQELSYFSRLSEASEFTRQALVEVFRRGAEKAGKVCAVTDGADWEQKFMDYHRPDAVRILDFAHAASSVAMPARAILGEDTPEFEKWFNNQRHSLKIGQSERVLSTLRRLEKKAKGRGRRKKLEALRTSVTYLEKRREMIKYGEFQALGYPIGSGCVESANKLVVESRMKQAGMRWARKNVDPMLALRNIACNDRWEEAWPQLVEHRLYTTQRRDKQRPNAFLVEANVIALNAATRQTVTETEKESENNTVRNADQRPKRKGAYRPPNDHAWKRMPFGSARYRTPEGFTRAKS
jgi:hypothetical protein